MLPAAELVGELLAPGRAAEGARDDASSRCTSAASASTRCRRSPCRGPGTTTATRSPPPPPSRSSSSAPRRPARLRADRRERVRRRRDLPAARRPPARDRARGRAREAALAAGDRLAARDAARPPHRRRARPPARQQTLRDAIDWSYNLLEPREQRLFARLGVFVGGCTLERREAVCGAPEGLGFGEVLDGIASLVDKSLVRQSDGLDGEPRFSLLETIREYALERLAERGELETLRRLHAERYLAVSEAAEPELVRAGQASWLDRLDEENDNIRAALAWSIEVGEVETGLRLAGALVRFWSIRGLMAEGRRWLTQALARAEGVPGGARQGGVRRRVRGARRRRLPGGEGELRAEPDAGPRDGRQGREAAALAADRLARDGGRQPTTAPHCARREEPRARDRARRQADRVGRAQHARRDGVRDRRRRAGDRAARAGARRCAASSATSG